MEQPIISIIVPTYKEAKNIPILVEQIDGSLKKNSLLYEIVIVDDNSEDGIVEVAEDFKKKCRIIMKVREEKRGLASAVIDGIELATGQIIVVMDADLSHPPAKIPELVKPILNDDYEMVIGSRYVCGNTNLQMNFFRILNARVSRWLAKPFTNVFDPLSGFFAFSKKLLKPDVKLDPIGFKIGLELMIKAVPQKILEVPIEFSARKYGKSKLTIYIQFQYIIHLCRILNYKFKK